MAGQLLQLARAAPPSPVPLMRAGRGGGDASFRTNGASPSRRHSATAVVTRHYRRAAPHPSPPPQRGAGIEESPASAFLSPTFSLAATPSPAPLMGAGWGGGDVVGSAARELSSRSGHRDFGRRPPTLACCLGRLIAEMQAERHIAAGGRRPRCGRPGPSLSLGVWHRGLAWSGRSSVVVLNRWWGV